MFNGYRTFGHRCSVIQVIDYVRVKFNPVTTLWSKNRQPSKIIDKNVENKFC